MPEFIALWLPFAVYPSDRAAGRLKPAIVKLPAEVSFDTISADHLQPWPVDVVLTELAARAIAWYRQAVNTKAKRTAATVDEMRQWIASTYAIADRVPLIDAPVVERMRTAAAQLQRILDSPQPLFSHWPSLGTTADAQKRASVYVWAIDRLVRHVNDAETAYAQLRGAGVECVTIPPAALWPALIACDEPVPPFADYTEALKRVRKLEQTLQPQAADALMVSILADVITHGRLGPDGQPRIPT